MAFLLFVLITLPLTSAGSRKIYDLTYRMTNFNQSRTTHPQFTSLYKQAFCSLENAGTHLNAPFKTNPYEWTLDKIPVKNFVAPLMIVRIDRDVKLSDITNWERRYQPIPKGSVVVLDSGWRSWEVRRKYLEQPDGYKTEPFPGFHISACKYLVQKLVVGVGVDTMSVDGGNALSRGRPCQKLLADNQCYILENLNNLSELPIVNAMIFVGALKMEGATGSPARVLAYVDNSSFKASSSWILLVVTGLTTMTVLNFIT